MRQFNLRGCRHWQRPRSHRAPSPHHPPASDASISAFQRFSISAFSFPASLRLGGRSDRRLNCHQFDRGAGRSFPAPASFTPSLTPCEWNAARGFATGPFASRPGGRIAPIQPTGLPPSAHPPCHRAPAPRHPPAPDASISAFQRFSISAFSFPALPRLGGRSYRRLNCHQFDRGAGRSFLAPASFTAAFALCEWNATRGPGTGAFEAPTGGRIAPIQPTGLPPLATSAVPSRSVTPRAR